VGRGGSVAWMRWWWWWGVAFVNARWERGLRAKKSKPSHSGSVSCCITAAGGGEHYFGVKVPPPVVT
jgi:hypothetical protein